MFRWMFLLIFLVPLTACDTSNDVERPDTSLLNKPAERKVQSPAASPVFEPLTATTLLQDQTQVHVFETTAEAFTVWRRAASERPTLLLISNNHMMVYQLI